MLALPLFAVLGLALPARRWARRVNPVAEGSPAWKLSSFYIGCAAVAAALVIVIAAIR
jgi:hypothetical protein